MRAATAPYRTHDTVKKTQIPLTPIPAKPAIAPFDPFAGAYPKGNESFSADQPQHKNSSGARCATGDSAANPTPSSYLKAVPAEWLEGYAILREMAPPETWPPSQWPKTVCTAGWFLECWGATAAALGWATLELFGVHPRVPYRRLDYMGLALSDRAERIAVMTEAEARLRHRASDLGHFRKPVSGDAIPIWALCHAHGREHDEGSD